MEFCSECVFNKLLNSVVSTPVGSFQSDVQGKCIKVDEFWTEITGIGKEDALGDGWLNFIHEDDRKRIEKEWIEFINGKVSRDYEEFRFVNPETGRVIWVRGKADRIIENGKFVGVIGILVEITQKINVLDRLLHLRNELREERDLLT